MNVCLDAIDIEVLRALHEWCRNGEDGDLVTVVQTLGSATSVGRGLAGFSLENHWWGAYRGCIEDDLLERCMDSASAPATQRIRYGGNAQEARRFGLLCNGSIELLVERKLCVEQLAQLRILKPAFWCVARSISARAQCSWSL